MTRDEEALRDVPDLLDWGDVARWIENRLDALARSSFSADIRSTFVGVRLEPASAATLGSFASSTWRRLSLAAFAADWACYPKPADRAEFVRMAYVTGTFPTGFRIWFCRLEDGCFAPVGYTGWYAVPGSVFTLLLERPETVTHRGLITPLPALEESSYLYLFNASIVAPLRGGPESGLLMRRFAEDIQRVQKKGLLSVTVSEDGQRFSRRFGMKQEGRIVVDGETEHVFARAEREPWF